MKHWKYLKTVLKHKWYVLQACLDIGLPLWVGVVHDWDKFLPRMWVPYANYFASNPRSKDGTYRCQDGSKSAFDVAWSGHQKLNKHHWQYWLVGTFSIKEYTSLSGGSCQCLVQNLKLPSSVRNADSNDPAKISSMVALCATSVASITQRTRRQTTTSIGKHVWHGIKNATLKTPKLIVNEPGISCENTGCSCLVTTAEIHLAAPAAASRISSFWYWITSKVVARSTAENTLAGWQVLRPIAGPSKTDTPQSSVSSVTTATAPTAFTVTVPIRRTLILTKDDGGFECISCHKPIKGVQFEALPMPLRHAKEMLADWRGAGRAYVKDWTPAQTGVWYQEHKDIMVLHPDTRSWIEEQLR